MEIIKKALDQSFIRFIFIGVINTIFGYGVFVFFIYCGFHYSLAALFGTLLGILFNFHSIGKLVFKNYSRSFFLKFILVYCLIYLFNLSGLFLFSLFHIDSYLAGAILLAPSALVSYLLNKYFVFYNKI